MTNVVRVSMKDRRVVLHRVIPPHILDIRCIALQKAYKYLIRSCNVSYYREFTNNELTYNSSGILLANEVKSLTNDILKTNIP